MFLCHNVGSDEDKIFILVKTVTNSDNICAYSSTAIKGEVSWVCLDDLTTDDLTPAFIQLNCKMSFIIKKRKILLEGCMLPIKTTDCT